MKSGTFNILLTIAPIGTYPETHESAIQDSLNLPSDLRLGLVICFRFMTKILCAFHATWSTCLMLSDCFNL